LQQNARIIDAMVSDVTISDSNEMTITGTLSTSVVGKKSDWLLGRPLQTTQRLLLSL
jgi:hypothetical protein